MELLIATAAEAADMFGVSCSSVYGLIAAKPLGSIKIGRSRRVSVASIRHVTAASAGVELVEPRTERSGESATPEESEEVGDVFRHDPLWTTADVAAFLSVPVQTIYDWRTRGYGPPGLWLGKHIRFRESMCLPGWTG